MRTRRTSAPLWYDLAWRCLAPFALLKLWWRGIREPGYREHIGERFGRYRPLPDATPVIWVHAVSVGETRAAQPLIAALRRDFPTHRIVMTVMTAAGRATSGSLYGDSVTRAWLSYDTTANVDRFLDWCKPRFGILMETELWPNHVLRAAARGVPMFVVNARMSEKSARGYARFGALTADVLGALRGIAAQGSGDADRLRSLGASAVTVTGNLKFDAVVPEAAVTNGQALRAMLGTSRPVWVAGSTRDGEEAMLLDAMHERSVARGLDGIPRPSTVPIPSSISGTLAVIVPRHPQRFDEVFALIEKRGLKVIRRSENRAVPPDVTVVVGDSMGEMLAYYAAADVAFVGGSLLPLGGQNLIEPLVVGTPVVIGPSSYNFADVTRHAVDAGAAVQCADAQSAIEVIERLLGDRPSRNIMAAAARHLLDEHRGATGRTMNYLKERLGA